MSSRHSTTLPQSYVPAVPPGAEGIPRIDPPIAPPIVQAGNQASSPGVAAVAFAVILVIALVVGFAGAMVLRWDARLAFVASVALAIGGSLLVLIVVNGDFPAWMEIRHRARIERQRIAAQWAAIEAHYQWATVAETNRHAEQVAQTEAHAAHSQLQNDVAYLMDQVQALRPLLADPGPAAPAQTFVTARPDEARLACEKWLAGLWDRAGTPKFVPGQLPMPWNGPGWRGQPWCDDARRLLLDSGVLVPRAGGRTFSVRPASRRDAMTMLDTAR